MKKIKVLSSFLEPFFLIATVIGLGGTVATNNYKYLAIPTISSIPIVTLSRLKNRDDIRELKESYKIKIDKLSLEADPNYQNERIKKLTQQSSKYQQKSRELQILLDSQAKDLEDQFSNYQNLSDLYYDREQKIKEYEAKVNDLIQESLYYKESYEYADSRLNELQEELQDSNSVNIEYNYEIIFERSGSRQVLMQALRNAEKQLILVCPWLTEYGVNYEVENLIINLLNNSVNIFIGWGHLSDLNNGVEFNEINLLNFSADWKYKKFATLKTLQRKYANLHLKLLGTHEKYLVCDHKFGMISSHNFLTSGDSSEEREISLKTDNPAIITKLIQRYNNEYTLESTFPDSDFSDDIPF